MKKLVAVISLVTIAALYAASGNEKRIAQLEKFRGQLLQKLPKSIDWHVKLVKKKEHDIATRGWASGRDVYLEADVRQTIRQLEAIDQELDRLRGPEIIYKEDEQEILGPADHK